MEFKEKFIAFVDILGFKNLVKAAENNTGMPLRQLLKIVKALGTPEDREKYKRYGPIICPESKYISSALDFYITQVSDCVIVSSEISPAGVINLLGHCWSAVIKLLKHGIMCRGYVTQGLIYHTEKYVVGSGYQKAYENEANVKAFKQAADERGTPFIEIDPVVCNYIKECSDKCVIEMFNRFVKQDGDVVALFPFKRLSHSFIVGGMFGTTFDPVKEKQSNQRMREMIQSMKDRIMSFVDSNNEKAVRKAEHYIRALDAQIEICNKTDEIIDKLCAPFPRNASFK